MNREGNEPSSGIQDEYSGGSPFSSISNNKCVERAIPRIGVRIPTTEAAPAPFARASHQAPTKGISLRLDQQADRSRKSFASVYLPVFDLIRLLASRKRIWASSQLWRCKLKRDSASARYSRPFTSSQAWAILDRKSTRLNSSHLGISYAVFGLK